MKYNLTITADMFCGRAFMYSGPRAKDTDAYDQEAIFQTTDLHVFQRQGARNPSEPDYRRGWTASSPQMAHEGGANPTCESLISLVRVQSTGARYLYTVVNPATGNHPWALRRQCGT